MTTKIIPTPDLTSVESPEIPAVLPAPPLPKPNLSADAIELLQAAKEFWRAVASVFPQYRAAIIAGEKGKP